MMLGLLVFDKNCDLCCFSYYGKQWVKRQKIVHTYGDDDDFLEPTELQAELEQRMRDGTVPHHIPTTGVRPDGVDVVLGGKYCKCGSTTHQRISHRDCPLN